MYWIPAFQGGENVVVLLLHFLRNMQLNEGESGMKWIALFEEAADADKMFSRQLNRMTLVLQLNFHGQPSQIPQLINSQEPMPFALLA